MKKILTVLCVTALVAVMAVGGTTAYFWDTETSAGNRFQAGTLDLRVNGDDNPSTLFTFTNQRPRQSQAATIRFENVGSLPGTLSFTLALTNADKSGTAEFGGGDVTAEGFAKCLIVTAATKGGTDIPVPIDVLSSWLAHADRPVPPATTAGDGKLSLYEMSRVPWAMVPGTLGPGASRVFDVTLQFDHTKFPGATSLLQAEGVDVAITGRLDQLR